jgi:protein-tyrosine-phosphatase/DNA-binding transcriptional ArsR family regulator
MNTTFPETPPAVMLILAHEIRWKLIQALVLSDYRVQELTTIVQRPLNLVSYHLKQLRAAQLVHERRSSADGRDLYYHLDLAYLQQAYVASGNAIHPQLVEEPSQQHDVSAQVHAPIRILFLCTHNSARSQMAEAIAHAWGHGRIEAYSAGTIVSQVHPDAIRVMAEYGVDIRHYTSKHMDPFLDQSFDYIVTVCDRVRERCPVFPNDPRQIHWSFPDPSEIEDPNQRFQQFQQIARELRARISYLLSFHTQQ